MKPPRGPLHKGDKAVNVSFRSGPNLVQWFIPEDVDGVALVQEATVLGRQATVGVVDADWKNYRLIDAAVWLRFMHGCG